MTESAQWADSVKIVTAVGNGNTLVTFWTVAVLKVVTVGSDSCDMNSGSVSGSRDNSKQ